MIAGIFDPIYQVTSAILAFFYQVTSSYSLAIALLTLAIMVLVLPLTLKSTKSMLEMQQLQPEIKKLQQQYPDMQQRNQAMMELYKEHNVSPLGGCLPMLLPLPLFYVMWSIIRGLTRACTDKIIASKPEFAERAVGSFCPDHLGTTTDIFRDLVGRTKMMSLGFDLSKPAVDQIRDSILRGLPYVALVLLVTGTSYYQQRQVTIRNKNQPVNPQQQMLLKIFPLLAGGTALFFPAGLSVYWLTQNLFRIGQNSYITRRFYSEGGLGHKAAQASVAAKEIADAKKADKAKGGNAKGGSGKDGGKPAPKPAAAKPTPPAKRGTKPVDPAKPPPSSPKKGSSGANGSGASRPSPQRPRPSRPAPRPKPDKT
jgi:YidC/Oxa1 family membrane protein insertase